MDTVQILNLALALVVLLILILGGAALIIIVKIRSKKGNDGVIQDNNGQAKNAAPNLITRDGKEIDSIYKFMEFDKIIDNMIIRKNSKQYVMVIECKGINYDLLSEDEKNAIEMGFIEMLNTLRFPIQLYVQTRTLNLENIIKEYERRTDELQEQINKVNSQIQLARTKGDPETLAKLQFDRRRKQNILEYGESIEDYTRNISDSKNILQQKTYIVISYYPTEYGDISKYTVDEINDIVFSELYTRCQTIIRALTSAEVTGKVLDSEELTELLYVAYNRDQSETYNLRTALDSEYDRLYSTARDVMEEKKRRIEVQIESDAAKIASKSIIKADIINREERAKLVKQRAKEMVDEYKNDLSKPLYDETLNQIDQTDVNEALDEDEAPTRRRVVKRKAQ